MNQVAVVIGGGQTLGAFLCHGLAAEGYRVAVVDIQSDKAANVAQEINAEYGEVWRTVLVLTPLASKAFWRSLVGR